MYHDLCDQADEYSKQDGVFNCCCLTPLVLVGRVIFPKVEHWDMLVRVFLLVSLRDFCQMFRLNEGYISTYFFDNIIIMHRNFLANTALNTN